METCETLVLNILTNEYVHCPFTCESFPSDEPKGIVRIWKEAQGNAYGILLDEHEVDIDKFLMENLEEFLQDEGFITTNGIWVYAGKYMDKDTYEKYINRWRGTSI